MTKSRRKFTAEQKAAIVRRHLKGKESISSRDGGHSLRVLATNGQGFVVPAVSGFFSWNTHWLNQ